MTSRTGLRRDAGKPLHPTARLLLDTVIELLDTESIDEVALATVLEKSSVSHGSLYHHFEDFPDLVEQAVVERFEAGLLESLAAIEDLHGCADATEFRARAEALIVELHEQSRRPYRLPRLEVLGATIQRPRLAARIARAQQVQMEAQAAHYAEFQRRGWFRDDLDPMALSAFTTATFLGRGVDDIIEHPVDPERWTEVALTAFRAVMFPD